MTQKIETYIAKQFGELAADYKSPYEEWKESEGLPTVRGLGTNVFDIDLAPWASRGGSGAFINLDGSEGFNDGYVCEIPPGKSLNPIKHIYEETILIMRGRGAATVWLDGKSKDTFEWGERSFFAIPPNAWFQLHNGSGTESAMYFAMTAAPRVINTFKELSFVFENPWVFGRYDGGAGYFRQADKYGYDNTWVTNFVADVVVASRIATEVNENSQRSLRTIGALGTHFEMTNSTMKNHSSSWPVGTYKGAHRHGPGIHVMILSGHGYALLWKEGEPERVDFKPGTIYVPGEGVWHMHFNTSNEPALFLAIGWGSEKPTATGGSWSAKGGSVSDGGNTIPFELEDPQIHKEYHEELAKWGVTCKMGGRHPYCDQT